MKLVVAALCVMVVMVTAKPSKRFISLHQIEHGLHHIGHEIEHGISHLGHELSHITGIHNPRDLACKLYPVVHTMGAQQCNSVCVGAATSSSAGSLAPLCPSACHMVLHEAAKLTGC